MSVRLVRRLSIALGIAYAVLGTLEVVLKLADGSAVATVIFFGATLLGGAGLILCGLVAGVSSTTRRVCVMLGAAIGMVASAWTLVVPALALAVIFANAQRPTVEA